jgi:hypothetical protein
VNTGLRTSRANPPSDRPAIAPALRTVPTLLDDSNPARRSVDDVATASEPSACLDARMILRTRRIGRWLTAIIAILVLADLATQYSKYHLGHRKLMGIVALLNLDGEGNLPAFYQSAVLLSAAAAAAVIANAVRRARRPFARHWGGLAGILLYLATDEAAGLHELLIEPLHDLLRAGGFLEFTWVVAGLAFVLVVGLTYLKFLLALEWRTRWKVLLAGGLYVSGAAGVEMIGAAYASRWGAANFGFSLLCAVEETLEMAGAALMLVALLGHARSSGAKLQLTVE